MTCLRSIVMAFVLGASLLSSAWYPTSAFADETGSTDESAHVETEGDSDGEHAEGDHAEGEHGEGEHGDDAHGGHSDVLPPILSFDPGAAVANVAIFLGVFLVLAKFVWPVILGGLIAREEKIASDLAAAQSANEEAKGLVTQYEQKLAEANAEAQGILAEARRDAETNASKIVDEAKADAKRQADRALADIETAKKVALSEIAGQTSALAMGVAKQVVGRELNPNDHAELIRKALEQVPSNN